MRRDESMYRCVEVCQALVCLTPPAHGPQGPGYRHLPQPGIHTISIGLHVHQSMKAINLPCALLLHPVTCLPACFLREVPAVRVAAQRSFVCRLTQFVL